MKNTASLEDRIAKLEARNVRVEADKAWETSWFRRLLIMTLTYVVVATYLHIVMRVNTWLNALVPVLGYLLSTLTVSYAKKLWGSRS